MDGENKRVAVYTRVSTEDQAREGFSLDHQIDKLRSYCVARNWKIVNEYVDDGFSGKNMKRPGYQTMMEDFSDWDVLLVLKMDRIHRNSKNFMVMMESLEKNKKEFVSLTESFDTSTAMGRFVMNIIQLIAQLESEQIGERVYIGMEQKAKSNKGLLGFNIPFGYDYVDHALIVNKNESRVVDEVFSQYLQGFSSGKIAEMLNDDKKKTKMGGVWSRKTILSMLKNPLYCGYIRWDSYVNKGVHEPIVSINTFNDVQNMINKNGGTSFKRIKTQ